jgi:ethanolamine-phosphate cytidylyltransferase
MSGHEIGHPEPKKPGVVRIWVDGCFDMMHYGHANLLRQAAALGDELYVGIHTDEEVNTFKGGYPVMTAEERYAAARACKWVTAVVEGAPYVTEMEDLKKHEIDYVAHGDDMSVDLNGNDSYAAVKAMGMMKIVRRTEGVSTTDLVGRMLLLTKTHHLFETEDESQPPVIQEKSREFVEACGEQTEGTNFCKFLTTSRRIVQFSSNKQPKEKDTIVYVDGDFDLFHPGHSDFLREAKKKGTFLIAGVHHDKVVNMKKGANFPIMNINERVLSVLSCRYVDECIIGVPFEVTEDLLKLANISIVCAGKDATRAECEVDPYEVPKKMGIFSEVDSGSYLTATQIIKRVIQNRLDYEARNLKKQKKDKDLQNTAYKVQEL